MANQKMGWVLRQPLPPMDDGTVLEVGKEIPDFDNPERWPNAGTLRLMDIAVYEPIGPEQERDQEPDQFDAKTQQETAADFTVKQAQEQAPRLDKETAERLLAEEKSAKKPRKGVVAAFEERVADFAEPDDGGATTDEIRATLTQTVDELKVAIGATDNASELERVLAIEQAGEDRSGVKEAIEARLAELNQAPG